MNSELVQPSLPQLSAGSDLGAASNKRNELVQASLSSSLSLPFASRTPDVQPCPANKDLPAAPCGRGVHCRMDERLLSSR